MARPIINGEAYSWSRIVINILGRAVIGVNKIDYKNVKAKSNNYGAGENPVSRTSGSNTPEASIELHMEEIQALRNVSPDGTLTGLPVSDIVVSYQPNNGPIVNHTIHNVEFLEDGVSVGKDTSNEIAQDLPLLPSHISFK